MVPSYKRTKGPIVSRAVHWLKDKVGLRGPTFSYLAGRTRQGQAIVVTVGDEQLTTTPPERHKHRRTGAVSALMWLTMAMLPSTQPTRTIWLRTGFGQHLPLRRPHHVDNGSAAGRGGRT